MSLNKFANSKVELRRVGGVNAPVGSRRELVRLHCQQLSHVGVGSVYWALMSITVCSRQHIFTPRALRC